MIRNIAFYVICLLGISTNYTSVNGKVTDPKHLDLAELEDSGFQPIFVGRWYGFDAESQEISEESYIDFKEDGFFTFKTMGETPLKGKWYSTNNAVVHMRFDNGNTKRLILQKNGHLLGQGIELSRE